jgi:hypothetical protein
MARNIHLQRYTQIPSLDEPLAYLKKYGHLHGPMYLCLMRSALSVVLICCVFVSALPVPLRTELAKTPALWHHYLEHKYHDRALSVIDFWAIHYGDDYQEHRHAHDHSDLPGKTGQEHGHTGCGCTQPPLLPPSLIAWMPSTATMAEPRQPFCVPSRLSGVRIRDIWQPPKA